MHFLRAMMQSSMFRFSTLLLSAIVLVPFDIPRTALAVRGPPGPSRGFSSPRRSDYPEDGEIRAFFTRPDPDGTVEWADLDGGTTTQVAEFCSEFGMKPIPDCFPPDYLLKNGRSDRWFVDFFYRYTVIYLRAARGWVYLVSRAEGPRPSLDTCSFWFEVQFPTLRENEAGKGIVLVNVENFKDAWVYWLRGEGDEAHQRPIPGQDGNDDIARFIEWEDTGKDGNFFNGLAGPLSTGAGIMGVVQTAVGGWTAAGMEAVRALWAHKKRPTSPAGDHTNQLDQPDPGIKTDVLDLKIGGLPDLPDGMDETSTITAKDPTLVADDFEANDGTSREEDLGIGGVLPTDNVLGDSNTATFSNLIGRGHRMRSRTFVGTCNGDSWVDDPSNPDFPGHKDTLIQLEISSKQASSYGLLYPFAPGELATLQITQYAKTFDSQRQSVDYHLDITILNPAGTVVFTEQQMDAPSGQEITVDAKLQLPLYIEVADKKDSPISFRYGDPLILNTVNGVRWDSNDKSQDHRCVTDPEPLWEDKRQITCLFKD